MSQLLILRLQCSERNVSSNATKSGIANERHNVQPNMNLRLTIRLSCASQNVSGNAAKSGIAKGDTIVYASSFFGDELWPTDSKGLTQSALTACPSPVALVYVRFANPLRLLCCMILPPSPMCAGLCLLPSGCQHAAGLAHCLSLITAHQHRALNACAPARQHGVTRLRDTCDCTLGGLAACCCKCPPRTDGGWAARKLNHSA